MAATEGGGGSKSSTADSYIGSLISLTSKSETDESSIGLTSVVKGERFLRLGAKRRRGPTRLLGYIGPVDDVKKAHIRDIETGYKDIETCFVKTEYSWNAQPRMNSEKQQRYRNQRSHVERRQHYYNHRRHEGRMNYDPPPFVVQTNRTMKRKVLDYLNPHQSDVRSFGTERRKKDGPQVMYSDKVEKRPRFYNHRIHEGRMNYYPYGYNFDRGHDHSKCLLLRKQQKEERPNFHPYLFVTEKEREEERALPLPSPSNKRELNIVLDNDDLPVSDVGLLVLDDDLLVFDDDRYEESMLKLTDYMRKALDKVKA